MDNGNEGCARPATARFGAYEADFETGELRKHGLRIKIQDKPLRVLQALVERPGRLVTRDELRARLWPADIYVDFDRNLKIALNKLRTALCDSAETPRYIETLPRRGYRFIAEVEHANGNAPVSGAAATAAPTNGSASNDHGGAPALLDTFAASPSPSPAAKRPFMWLSGSRAAWAATALALALVAGTFFVRAHYRSASARLEFHQRDWVLVSRFENRTGEPVLDGTVDFAVARELSNSQFVGVVPPERVGDDLRLMEKPPGSPLDRELAREICLRDGGIRALIAGRVEKIGTNYVLSAGIVDPATDAQVAGVSAEARDLNGVLPAVRQLSNQLRESLGETLPSIQAGNPNLEKVTTPSLRALQLYSRADAIAIEQGPPDKPIPLLEEALAEDPNFASAHILLAWCYGNFGKPTLAAPHFQKAFELASTVSERERLFILGSYYDHVKGDPEKAIQAYEALVRLYPDDFWGINNLVLVLYRRGRVDEAVEFAERRADLRPADFTRNLYAWVFCLVTGRDADAAHYLARAKSLITPEIEEENPDGAMAIESAEADADVWNLNIPAALNKTRRLAATYTSRTRVMRIEVADAVGELYLELGMLRAAAEWFQKVPPEGFLGESAPMDLAEARGIPALRKTLEAHLPLNGPGYGYDTVVRLARCGMLKKSRQLLSRLQRRGTEGRQALMCAQGSLELYEGHREQAVALLKETLEGMRQSPRTPVTRYTADALATAYEQEGRFEEAIHTLQPFEDRHQLAVDQSFHLFQLYQKAGDARDAQQVRERLLLRLSYADPDYPILVKLRQPTKLHAGLALKP